jgi:S1-C subfamily serine protease
MQVILLVCLIFTGVKLYNLERNRIPPAVFNFNVSEKFSAIPLDLLRCTVRIHTDSGVGSGVAISKNLLITNSHVVTGLFPGDTVWIEMAGKKGWYKTAGKIITIDKARDLSVIKIPSRFKFKNTANLVDKDPVWGSAIVMVGCPKGMMPVPARGYYGYRYGGKMQIVCASFWGNSGGPIFNGRGQIVALAHKLKFSVRSGRPVLASHLNVCIPYDWIKAHLVENHLMIAEK